MWEKSDFSKTQVEARCGPPSQPLRTQSTAQYQQYPENSQTFEGYYRAGTDNSAEADQAELVHYPPAADEYVYEEFEEADTEEGDPDYNPQEDSWQEDYDTRMQQQETENDSHMQPELDEDAYLLVQERNQDEARAAKTAAARAAVLYDSAIAAAASEARATSSTAPNVPSRPSTRSNSAVSGSRSSSPIPETSSGPSIFQRIFSSSASVGSKGKAPAGGSKRSTRQQANASARQEVAVTAAAAAVTENELSPQKKADLRAAFEAALNGTTNMTSETAATLTAMFQNRSAGSLRGSGSGRVTTGCGGRGRGLIQPPFYSTGQRGQGRGFTGNWRWCQGGGFAQPPVYGSGRPGGQGRGFLEPSVFGRSRGQQVVTPRGRAGQWRRQTEPSRAGAARTNLSAATVPAEPTKFGDYTPQGDPDPYEMGREYVYIKDIQLVINGNSSDQMQGGGDRYEAPMDFVRLQEVQGMSGKNFTNSLDSVLFNRNAYICGWNLSNSPNPNLLGIQPTIPTTHSMIVKVTFSEELPEDLQMIVWNQLSSSMSIDKNKAVCLSYYNTYLNK